MRLTILFFVLLASVCRAQDDDGPIKVYLNSGKVLSTRYIYLDHGGGFTRAFLRLNANSKEKISIDMVDHVEGPDQTGKQRYVRPIEFAGSDVWGERTFQSDRITMYYVGVVTWGVGFPMKTKHFQYTRDGGPLKKVTMANVGYDVHDNPESMALVRKAKVATGVQAGLYVAGAALAIGSAVAWAKEDDDKPKGPGNVPDTDVKVPVGAIVGMGICIIPSFLRPGKQKNLVKALEVYK